MVSGNLHFVKDKAGIDISLASDKSISYEFIVPHLVNFSDPHVILKVKNESESAILEFRLESCSKNFEISKIIASNPFEGSTQYLNDGAVIISNFSPKTSIEILCKFSASFNEMKSLKLAQYLSKSSESDIRSIIHLDFEFPEPWTVEVVEMNRHHLVKQLKFRPSWSIREQYPFISFQNSRCGSNRINDIVM